MPKLINDYLNEVNNFRHLHFNETKESNAIKHVPFARGTQLASKQD